MNNNKKKINILLIILVLGLWGSVLYKYVNRFFYTNEKVSFNRTALNSNIPDKIKKDTFALKPLTKDPFLSRSYETPIRKQKPVNSIKKPIAKKQQQVNPKTIVPFPIIKYFGFIKSKEKKEEMILIKVGSRLHKTRLNENCDGVKVKKIFKDSVQVVFDREVKTIKKQS